MLIKFLQSLIPLVGTLIAGYFVFKPKKQDTARLIFDKSYSKIHQLIENHFYDAKLSEKEIKNFAGQILIIFNNSSGYYSPLLKDIVFKIYHGNSTDLYKDWCRFCFHFDFQYEKISGLIGIPSRPREFRIEKGQFYKLGKTIYFRIFSRCQFEILLGIAYIAGSIIYLYFF